MEPPLKQLFQPEEIHLAVTRLANDIRKDYAGKSPLLIGILKGSFIFLADIVRSLKIPVEIDFIRAASYGSGDTSSGNVQIIKDIDADIENRDVIVIEDVVDTGLTLNVVLKHLKAKNPASLRLCALVDKPDRRQVPIKIDYLGFHAKEGFLVGYGLDYNEKYRYLQGLYVMG
ncbi:MAG: hypoxanthine phosphoribosyltransferase [Deltaproteobacteria bacterium]|nr:hypoxanthine phosphoribosyltransferase [Deltaproteobacteria bacterium]